MKAVQVTLSDRLTRESSRTRAGTSRATMDDRFCHARASEAARLQARAALTLPLRAAQRIRESFEYPKARASLKSQPRDWIQHEPVVHRAQRAVNRRVASCHCRES